MSCLLGKAIFMSMDMHNFINCVMIFKMTCIYHCPTHYFVLFTSLFQLCVNSVAVVSGSLAVSSSDVVNTTNAMAFHYAFYFQDSGLHLSLSGTWSGVLCDAHIVLKEHQVLLLMLCRITFHLSGMGGCLTSGK